MIAIQKLIYPESDATNAAYYQSLIGILRWMVELGRVYITTEVSMLSSCFAMPREGHLKQDFRMFTCLKKQQNPVMVFDHTVSAMDYSEFQKQDWKNTVYTNERGELKEDVLLNMPTPLGKRSKMRVFVDSDHAGDQVTRRSRTEFLIYLKNLLIYWSSKKHTTVETSSFGRKFMAIKHATEYVRGIQYKLRSMGVPVNECAYIYGDNKSVLVNLGTPYSQMKKKSNSVADHHVREGSALDEWRTGYFNMHENIVDLMTKNLPFGVERTKFCKMLLHFFTPSVEVGEGDDHHAAASTMTVLPGQWIEVIIGVVTVWEEQAVAQA